MHTACVMQGPEASKPEVAHKGGKKNAAHPQDDGEVCTEQGCE